MTFKRIGFKNKKIVFCQFVFVPFNLHLAGSAPPPSVSPLRFSHKEIILNLAVSHAFLHPSC